MGKLNTILAACFCATAPLSSITLVEPKTETVTSSLKLGKEIVSSVRSGYENGIYNEFLTEMDVVYKDADVAGLLKMRQKEVPASFQQEWEDKFLDLQKERNQQILSIIPDDDETAFAKKARSMAANLLTPEQEKAISRLNALIAKAPGTGVNEDENQLIDIDLEYEYKLLHSEYPTSDVSPQKRVAYQLALRMEKMDKMVEASRHFEDLSLKQAVNIAADTLDERLSRNLDGVDLNRMLKAKVKPSSPVEEKVLSILSSYQGKFTDLMKQIDAANR